MSDELCSTCFEKKINILFCFSCSLEICTDCAVLSSDLDKESLKALYKKHKKEMISDQGFHCMYCAIDTESMF